MTMNFRQAFTAVTMLGSLLAFGPQAQAIEGIDFDTGSATVSVTSTSTVTPTVLRTVTATCPNTGFLLATASSLFTATPGAVNGTQFLYSIAKDATTFDNTTRYTVAMRDIKDPGGASVPSSALMRVDSCTAGQSVTYRFLAAKGVDLVKLNATQPKLVVTFFQKKI
jgi:hypothetical protein